MTCERCPERFFLAEQAEVLVHVATLETAMLVPETAVSRYDGASGTVWTVEEGRLKRRRVLFGQRTEDARLEIKDGLPPGATVSCKDSARRSRRGVQQGSRRGPSREPRLP